MRVQFVDEVGQQGQAKEDRAAAAAQSVERRLPFVLKLHWHAKHVTSTHEF